MKFRATGAPLVIDGREVQPDEVIDLEEAAARWFVGIGALTPEPTEESTVRVIEETLE